MGTKPPTEAPLDLTKTARDVSVTERAAFRSCRRRWRLETIENLTPKTPSWALTFGTGIHAALEEYYRSGDPGLVLRALDKWHAETEKELKTNLGPLCTGEVLDELWDLRNLGVGMLTNYIDYDQSSGEKWKVLAIEGDPVGWPDMPVAGSMPALAGGRYPKSAAVVRHESGRLLCPIVHPRTLKCLPGRPYLSARIDLLVERTVPGKKGVWIVDHKTSTSQPSDRGIDFEDQITGYCYVVWRGTGIIPRGVIFNYLIKQLPKEPRRNQAKVNGSTLSTAKDQLCLPSAYRKELEADGLIDESGHISSEKHAECYDALLARGWDPFFRRFEVQRNEHELRSFEERLYEEYKDMREAYKNPARAYPNPSSWHCPNCSVAPICQAMEDGSDVQGIIDSLFIEAPDRKA